MELKPIELQFSEAVTAFYRSVIDTLTEEKIEEDFSELMSIWLISQNTNYNFLESGSFVYRSYTTKVYQWSDINNMNNATPKERLFKILQQLEIDSGAWLNMPVRHLRLIAEQIQWLGDDKLDALIRKVEPTFTAAKRVFVNIVRCCGRISTREATFFVEDYPLFEVSMKRGSVLNLVLQNFQQLNLTTVFQEIVTALQTRGMGFPTFDGYMVSMDSVTKVRLYDVIFGIIINSIGLNTFSGLLIHHRLVKGNGSYRTPTIERLMTLNNRSPNAKLDPLVFLRTVSKDKTFGVEATYNYSTVCNLSSVAEYCRKNQLGEKHDPNTWNTFHGELNDHWKRIYGGYLKGQPEMLPFLTAMILGDSIDVTKHIFNKALYITQGTYERIQQNPQTELPDYDEIVSAPQ